MKKIFLALLLIAAVACLCSCSDGGSYPLSLEQMILEDLIDQYYDIIYKEGYVDDIEACQAIVNDPKATSSQVTEAIEKIRQIKDSILNRSIYFTDSEFEALVRLSLGIPEGGSLTYEDIIGVKTLDLSAREGHCITFIEDLSNFPELESLDLSGNAIIDFAPIAKLSSLKSLNISGAAVSATAEVDLSFLDTLSGLESLSAENAGLTGLSFLASHPTLTSLDVGRNPITDYSGLLHCLGLKELNVSGGSFTGMTMFAMFAELKTFILEDGTLGSLSGIESMGLTKLDLSGTPLVDCEPLSSLSSLRTLDLSGTGITSVAPLAGMGITRLYASDNRITDGSVLSTLTSLISADLSGNDLGSLNLMGSGSLMELDLSDNNMSSLYLNGDHSLLSRLDISDNSISSVGFGTATSITELYADNNDLSSAGFISSLTSLKKLSLSGNHMSSMPSLRGHSITELHLADVPLWSLSFLEGVDSLVYLDLLDTKLTDISGLADKTKLRTLRIKLSDVTDFSALETLTGLTDLYLYGIKDDFWPSLLTLQSLESLYITRSKITYAAISGLPALKSLSIVTCRPLTDLSRIHDLPALESLYLDYVDVYRPYVSGFPNLKSLTIIDGNVEDVSGISDLPACEYIDLTDNSTLATLTFNVLPSLKTLILADCRLSNTDLKNLRVVMNMGTLDLSDNSISKLKSFPFEKDDLIRLDVSDNKISDFSPLYPLEIAEVIWDDNRGTYAPPEAESEE